VARWKQRFLSSARGQVVQLLRRGSRTVDELARLLDLTDNAVRAQLAALERDGLVEQRGLRRGTGRPAYSYRLTPEADSLFSTAYAEVLRRVLGVFAVRQGEAAVEGALRTVGRDLGRAMGGQLPGETVQERLEGVTRVLGELGGLAEVHGEDGHFVLEGYGCPLRAIVPEHPAACQLALALVQELLGGRRVSECCVRGADPHCRFEVSARPPDGELAGRPAAPPTTTAGPRGSEPTV
jgi:predicted ArsR family transcriptional regulator